jgi:dUTP pyrophosphatase
MRIPFRALPNFPVSIEQFGPTEGNVGIDVFAANTVAVAPGERVIIPTGLAVELPDGVELQVRPRSGLAAKCGMTVLNSPGTIDPSYRGEISVIVQNHTSVFPTSYIISLFEILRDGHLDTVDHLLDEFLYRHREQTVWIHKGDRIAQFVLANYLTPEIEWVDEMSETTRGTHGFGSTGIHS